MVKQDMPESSVHLNWVILKVTQKCNLDCTYCYVYHRGDESWRTRPAFISNHVIDALGDRIVEQVRKYNIEEFVVELHGGEPLLLGKKRFEELVSRLSARCDGVRLRFIMQTNGLLLDSRWLEILDRNCVTFGVSLDGPPEVADRARVKLNGEPSSAELLERLASLKATTPLLNRLLSGYLCVVSPDADGATLMHWFADLGVRGLDFLLPDGNHANLPSGWTGAEPYRRFLIDAFDVWYAMDGAGPRVRIFETMILGLLGVRPTLDAFGGRLESLCVVESGGSIGVADTLRICGGPFATDSLNIFEHPLDLHAQHYGLDAAQRLSDSCLSCPYLHACGGGYLPHRYDGVSFQNPSIYCQALYGLAEHIHQQLLRDLPPSVTRSGGTLEGTRSSD